MNIEIVKLNARQESYYSRQHEPFRHSNKMYIWTEGETVMENLIHRKSRPHTFYKKEIIPLIMKKLQEQFPEIYSVVEKEKWGWRQKCGCSCPCSPGFVGQSMGGFAEIHATIKFSE